MVQERGWCVCVLCINRERRMIQMWQSANILGIWGRGRRDFLVLFCNFFVSKIFWKDFAYLVLERGEGREKEREISMWERYINWFPLAHAPTGDLTCNPDMCPDWESNRWLFGSQASIQPTVPHQPGPNVSFMVCVFYLDKIKWQEDRHKRRVCLQCILLLALNTDAMPGATTRQEQADDNPTDHL